MNLYDSMAEMKAREEHLSKLEQPGPVDLGPEDNEQAQDDLFAELRQLRAIIGYAAIELGVEV